MDKSLKRLSIYFIDQAVSFGGSLVVNSTIVNNLDESTYKTFVNTEFDPVELDHIFDISKTTCFKHYYNYSSQQKISNKIRTIFPSYLSRYLLITNSLIRTFINLPYIFNITSFINKNKIDIVHLSNGLDNYEICLVSLFVNCKFIVHFHGVSDIDPLCKRLISKTSCFLSISRFIQDQMTQRRINSSKFRLIYNPVRDQNNSSNINHKELKSMLGINNETRVIGLFGRIVEWKGHLHLAQAINEVIKEHNDIKVLIVGDKSDGDIAYYNKLKMYIRTHNLEQYFIFTGYASNTDDYYNICDLTVHTSIEPEPFGLVIIESMINSIPVIASKYGAASEIITHNYDGLISDPLDKYKFSRDIIYILNHPKTLDEMGKNAKHTVVSKYSIDNYMSQLEAIYQAV